MKLALKDFQEDAVEQLIKKLNPAKREVAEGGDRQAVILAAPTGSGKTVITAALIEEILNGSDRFEAEPDAVFLWLSDQPVLNEQSKKRIASASTKLGNSDLVIVDADFDRETFTGGKLYFINTQKLGKDKLLTSGRGDKRTYTIWDTIANTAKTKGDRFYLIIDEAHRGTKVSRNDETNRLTVMQKFVKGSEGEIPPIDLILGVSATPQRFQQLVDGQANRTPRRCEVNPLDVRASGLLKDRIMVFYPNKDFPTDWTMLKAAVQQWRVMGEEWRAYTQTQNLPAVLPALIIQVEDGSSEGLSKTDLDKVIATVEEETGPLHPGEIAHCFEHDAPISAHGVLIPKMDPSRIQEETGIRFVLFKMALTTGWDCPRAEVMMSFRRAQDDTLIAQLIGRMVRTPLARRIEGSESLNSVSLYLPHYEKEGLTRVVNHLKHGDPMELPPTDVEDGAKLVTFKRDKDMDEAFEALTDLPCYRVERIRKVSNTRRLMRLSRLLTTMHQVDMSAWDDAKKLVIDTLNTEIERLKQDDAGFDAKLKASGEITLNAVAVEQGTWKEIHGQTITVPLDDKNIEDLFNRAGQRLGEGLHLDFWQTHYDADVADDMPSRSRLTLFSGSARRKGVEDSREGLRRPHSCAAEGQQDRHQEADDGGAGGIQQGAGSGERPRGSGLPAADRNHAGRGSQRPGLSRLCASPVYRRHRAFRRAVEQLGTRCRPGGSGARRCHRLAAQYRAQAVGAGSALRTGRRSAADVPGFSFRAQGRWRFGRGHSRTPLACSGR
jgi:type III restriction enzyme